MTLKAVRHYRDILNPDLDTDRVAERAIRRGFVTSSEREFETERVVDVSILYVDSSRLKIWSTFDLETGERTWATITTAGEREVRYDGPTVAEVLSRPIR